MTNLEILEVYKEFCKKKGIKSPGIIPRIYSEEDTLIDALNSVYSQGFRLGKDAGWDEGRAYSENEKE